MVPLKTQSMVPPVQFHMVLQHYATWPEQAQPDWSRGDCRGRFPGWNYLIRLRYLKEEALLWAPSQVPPSAIRSSDRGESKPA